MKDISDLAPGEILYFSAEWCQPCKTFKYVVSAVEEEYGIEVTRLDIDKEKTLGHKLNVMSVPTIIKIHPKDPYSIEVRIHGAVSKESLIMQLGLGKE